MVMKKINYLNDSFSESLAMYEQTSGCTPLLMCGDSLEALAQLPPDSIDFIMTSPHTGGNENMIMEELD